MNVTLDTIREAVRSLDLQGRVVCVHSSLRSFGVVEGAAATVVEGLLAEGCTVLAPTFSWAFAVPPPSGQRPARNGCDYDGPWSSAGTGRVYTPAATDIDREMGAIPAALLAVAGRVRGNHPLSSFTAVGPRAQALLQDQSGSRAWAPLEALVQNGGRVLLMGVGLTRMTLLHLAEQRTGRRLFRRWANAPDGQPAMVEVGGCSAGFESFRPLLAPLAREAWVGESRWQVFPAAETLTTAIATIEADPRITHCASPACGRCPDAVLGGPLIEEIESS